MLTLRWTRIYSSIRTYVACYDANLNEVWYGIRYLTACFRSDFLTFKTRTAPGRTFVHTHRFNRMWKGDGLRRKDERCLNCAFQFRTEASGKSLSLSLSHVPCTQHGIRETLEAEQFKILEHRVSEVGEDNEIFHQVHRTNLWNNTYCRASNVILFLACIQKITMPTVMDISSRGYHS